MTSPASAGVGETLKCATCRVASLYGRGPPARSATPRTLILPRLPFRTPPMISEKGTPMQYTVTDSKGKRVTSIRTGKAKPLVADITGAFTLSQGQVIELSKAGYRVTALSRKMMRAQVTRKGEKPRTLALGTAQIVELFRRGYNVEPIRAPATRKRSNEPTIPVELYYRNSGRS